MNTLLIGSNDISPALLEHMQRIVDGSVFLAGSIKEALHLVRNYTFRFIVLIIRNEQDLTLFHDVVVNSPVASHIVCGGDIAEMKKTLETGAATWVPDFETLVTFLEFREERRIQTDQNPVPTIKIRQSTT